MTVEVDYQYNGQSATSDNYEGTDNFFVDSFGLNIAREGEIIAFYPHGTFMKVISFEE